MCLDCGCGEYNNPHDDPRHITLDDIQAAATASGISAVQVAQRISEVMGWYRMLAEYPAFLRSAEFAASYQRTPHVHALLAQLDAARALAR